MTTTPRTVGCDILTREAYNEGEDLASVSDFNALDRVYMPFPLGYAFRDIQEWLHVSEKKLHDAT
jgi:hypothetical protein